MITLALLASTLAQPVLLESFPNDGNVVFPVVEYKAKDSHYWTGTQVFERPAHVLELKLRINGASQGQTLIAVPLTMEFGDATGAVYARQNWEGIGDVLVATFTAQTDISIHLPSASHNPTGDLVGASFPVYARFWYDPPGEPPPAEYTYSIQFTVEKHTALEDAGVDTRRTHLTANKEPGPSWPPGPNSELDYFKFGSWTYNGGLFAGTIQEPDRSGLGRTQFRFPAAVTNLSAVKHMALSLFTMPIIEKGGNILSVGAYWPRLPHGTLPAENDQSWSNRFDIDPGDLWDGQLPDPELYSTIDLSRLAVWSTTFAGFDPQDPDAQDYACWQLTGGLPLAEWHDLERVCVATLNEDEVGGPFGYAWRSFASKEFNAEELPFPHHDVAPRLWVVKTGALTQH